MHGQMATASGFEDAQTGGRAPTPRPDLRGRGTHGRRVPTRADIQLLARADPWKVEICPRGGSPFWVTLTRVEKKGSDPFDWEFTGYIDDEPVGSSYETGADVSFAGRCVLSTYDSS